MNNKNTWHLDDAAIVGQQDQEAAFSTLFMPNNSQDIKIEEYYKPSHPFRMWFMTILVLLTYGYFIWNAFWLENIVFSAGIYCILFIELIFFAIDLKDTSKRKIWLILIIIGGVVRLFMPNPVWQLAVALRISIFMIGFLISFLGKYFREVRTISRHTYFMRGGYIFTLMTTVLFGFFVLGANKNFPFQCEQISGWSEKLINTSTSPLQVINKPEEKNVFDFQEDIEGLDILGLISEEEDTSLIQDLFKDLKTNVMDGFVETQKSVSTKMCETIIGQIEQVYQNPVFQIGVVFMIYLLVYGVVRLLVWIVTFLGYILFCFIRLFGGYKVERRRGIIEEVI